MHLGRAFLIAVAGLALLSACDNSNDDLNCSSVGAADPGIQFNFDAIVDSHPQQQLRVKACLLDGTGKDSLACENAQVRTGRSPGGPQGALTVGRGMVDEETGTIIARLVISDAAGARLFSGKTLVTPILSEPNGKGCPGKSWFGSVTTKGSRLQEDVFE